MEYLMFMPCLILIGMFIVIVFKSKDERTKFHVLKFDSDNYLIITLLYGNIGIKTSIGSFFIEEQNYILKCEFPDKTIKEFNIKNDEIDKLEINEVTDVNVTEKILDYEFDYSKSYFSGRPQGEFTNGKGLKYSMKYQTKMTLKTGQYIVFQSKKNPKEFFTNKSDSIL